PSVALMLPSAMRLPRPADQVQLPGRLGGLHAAENRNGGPVSRSALPGPGPPCSRTRPGAPGPASRCPNFRAKPTEAGIWRRRGQDEGGRRPAGRAENGVVVVLRNLAPHALELRGVLGRDNVNQPPLIAGDEEAALGHGKRLDERLFAWPVGCSACSAASCQ